MAKKKQYCIASVTFVYDTLEEVLKTLRDNETDLSSVVIGTVLGKPEMNIKIKKSGKDTIINKEPVNTIKEESLPSPEQVTEHRKIVECDFCASPRIAFAVVNGEKIPVCATHSNMVQGVKDAYIMPAM